MRQQLDEAVKRTEACVMAERGVVAENLRSLHGVVEKLLRRRKQDDDQRKGVKMLLMQNIEQANVTAANKSDEATKKKPAMKPCNIATSRHINKMTKPRVRQTEHGGAGSNKANQQTNKE